MFEPTSDVTKEALLTELNLELQYHEADGPSYRSETTRLAIKVANSLPDTDVYFDRSETLKVVKKLIKEENEYRLLDVAKMLSVITKDLHRRKNVPEDIKVLLEERKKKRKPLKIVKKTNS